MSDNHEVYNTDGSVTVHRTSPLTNKSRFITVIATKAQFWRYFNGQMIQEAFPTLTADEREFILTGITGDEWDEAFIEREEAPDGSL